MSTGQPFALIAGVDLGDKTSHICVLNAASGGVVERSSVRTCIESFERYFSKAAPMRVALETGTHSPWASRTIASFGHDVIVANSRELQLVYNTRRKSDRIDAEKLARLARLDVKLLAPVQHRSAHAQQGLALLRSRSALVRARTMLINHVRGVFKSFGYRTPPGSAAHFPVLAREVMPEELANSMLPALNVLEGTTAQIIALEGAIKELAAREYPEVALLMQVPGVGLITAMTFILTIEDPRRFESSRIVGAYLGLVPGRRQSGARDEKEGITKQGDSALRVLLVQCTQYILRRSSPDSDLKRHGLKIAGSNRTGGKQAAIIAVARKLAVLLHALWVTGEVYEPLRNQAA